MHPRNIFRDKPPDFKALGNEFPEFKQYVQVGQSGKAWINFKDAAALKTLSCVLLKKYFSINIDIPLDRLIPTVPLRLNYIHWIEDLLETCKQEAITGIDIGKFVILLFMVLHE